MSVAVSYLLVVVSVGAAIVSSADAVALNCIGRYHAVLQQALNIEQECGILTVFEDCCQVRSIGKAFPTETKTGIYEITDVCTPSKVSFQGQQATVKARCDLEGDDGGWLVILRRDKNTPEPVDFSRNWADYVSGFGDLDTEFWYGLQNIYCLTTREEVDLKIVMKKDDGTEETWIYRDFKVDGAHTNYALTIGNAEGPPGGSDRMAWHNGSAFSTAEHDHDTHPSANCAQRSDQGAGGGWWYKNCRYAVFTTPHTSTLKIFWGNNDYAYAVEMQVRPKSCVRPEACD